MSGFASLYPTYNLFMTICQLEMVLYTLEYYTLKYIIIQVVIFSLHILHLCGKLLDKQNLANFRTVMHITR